MCENQGELKGDEVLRSHGSGSRRDLEHNFRPDMAELNREGDEMSGDEHSSGYQGDEAGLPGNETVLQEEQSQRKAS